VAILGRVACLARSGPGLSAALLAALLAVCGSSAAGAAGARPVPILTYHHVGAAPGGSNRAVWVPERRFRSQVRALAGAGYRAVTLDRVWSSWHGGPALPRHPVVLTFDDGYADQFAAAAPVLRARRWPGVLNLETGRLGVAGGLGRAQVRALLSRGWQLAAHSVTHPDLTKVGPKRLTAEVAGSRRALLAAFGIAPSFFCYPYGHHDAAVRSAVRRAGFTGATTTHRGLASPASSPLALNRISVGSGTSVAALLHTLRQGG
jgi:peptidoglycan/xylan/chitin deacetylase (PgdA/CDA1 family)